MLPRVDLPRPCENVRLFDMIAGCFCTVPQCCLALLLLLRLLA